MELSTGERREEKGRDGGRKDLQRPQLCLEWQRTKTEGGRQARRQGLPAETHLLIVADLILGAVGSGSSSRDWLPP